jgi:hypothetical protein
VQWHVPFTATVRSIKQEDHSQGQPGQKPDPISKIAREKRARAMAQEVEQL